MCLALIAPSRSSQNSRRRRPHGESVVPSFLAHLPAGCHASEAAHLSRTRAQIDGLEIATSALQSHGDPILMFLLVQKSLERDRLRAELRLMKAPHLQLKQAIELQGKASKKRAAICIVRGKLELHVVVSRDVPRDCSCRRDRFPIRRFTSLLKAEIARKASLSFPRVETPDVPSAQWMSSFAKAMSGQTDLAKSFQRRLEHAADFQCQAVGAQCPTQFIDFRERWIYCATV